MALIDKETIRKEIERRITDNTFGAKLELIDILAFLDSLPDETKCIFGNKPSEEGCRYCVANCKLRVPKTESSSSVTFEEYLHGIFEINNGLDNDPALLVTLHAPTLLELAKEKLRKDEPEVLGVPSYEGVKVHPRNMPELRMVEVTDKWEKDKSVDVEVAMQNLDEKIKLASKTWEGVDVDEYMGEVRYGKEPTSDDLKDEIARYLREECSADDEPSISDIARHFAEWGAEHLRDITKMVPEGLEEATENYVHTLGCDEYEHESVIAAAKEDFIAGAKWDRAKMMEKAVEADVNTYEDLATGESWAEFVVKMPTKNLGDKVRVIVIPEEK